MDSMSVKTAQVAQLSQQLGADAKKIATTIETLEKEINTLRGAWSGEAQASYDQAQVKWTQSLLAMQELLTRISTSTLQVAQNYNASDSRNAKRFLP